MSEKVLTSDKDFIAYLDTLSFDEVVEFLSIAEAYLNHYTVVNSKLKKEIRYWLKHNSLNDPRSQYLLKMRKQNDIYISTWTKLVVYYKQYVSEHDKQG